MKNENNKEDDVEMDDWSKDILAMLAVHSIEMVYRSCRYEIRVSIESGAIQKI